MRSFTDTQRDIQVAFRQASPLFPSEAKKPGGVRGKSYPFVLPTDHWRYNLFPTIRDGADAYFRNHGITWHQMRHHLLSSQVCCLNFLMPFASCPSALAELIAPVFPNATMLPIEEGRYIAFEWISSTDFLNEASANRKRRRGANCTSADAAIKFRTADGTTIIALIEWKYTELYGGRPDPKRLPERLRRYSGIAFAPDGPLRESAAYELSDLFWEPFYQYLRQQMLAYQVQNAKEADCDRAVVLHISPAANVAFQRITAPALKGHHGSATSVWKSLLADPSAFVSVTTDELFGPFDASKHPCLEGWSDYIRTRYGSLLWSR